jgi:hypothetical protein
MYEVGKTYIKKLKRVALLGTVGDRIIKFADEDGIVLSWNTTDQTVLSWNSIFETEYKFTVKFIGTVNGTDRVNISHLRFADNEMNKGLELVFEEFEESYRTGGKVMRFKDKWGFKYLWYVSSIRNDEMLPYMKAGDSILVKALLRPIKEGKDERIYRLERVKIIEIRIWDVNSIMRRV